MTYSYYFPEHHYGCMGFDSIQSAYNEAIWEDLYKNGAYFQIGYDTNGDSWEYFLYDSRNGGLK